MASLQELIIWLFSQISNSNLLKYVGNFWMCGLIPAGVGLLLIAGYAESEGKQVNVGKFLLVLLLWPVYLSIALSASIFKISRRKCLKILKYGLLEQMN